LVAFFLLARLMEFINAKNLMYFFIPSYLLVSFGLYHKSAIPHDILILLPNTFAFIGLMLVLKSFSERRNMLYTWLLIVISHFWISMAVGYNEEFDFNQIYLYLSGVIVSGALGYFILVKMAKVEPGIDLSQFHGHVYEYPGTAFAFLMGCLGLTGFPISPTFVGEDLLYTHIHDTQVVLAFFISLSFVVDGLSIIRVFARVFLGPHIKTYHEVAYKSS
jgi:formate hydrogenlyase subunit 3/multisubunit Na+/H+ antiporter MnhD subunit